MCEFPMLLIIESGVQQAVRVYSFIHVREWSSIEKVLILILYGTCSEPPCIHRGKQFYCAAKLSARSRQ
jgi:hypothetical protein